MSASQRITRGTVSISTSKSAAHASATTPTTLIWHQRCMDGYARSCEIYAEAAKSYNERAKVYLEKVEDFNTTLATLLQSDATYALTHMPKIPSLPKQPTAPVFPTKPFEPRQSVLSVLREVESRDLNSLLGTPGILVDRSKQHELVFEYQSIMDTANENISWTTQKVALANAQLQSRVQVIKADAVIERDTYVAIARNYKKAIEARYATISVIETVSGLPVYDSQSKSAVKRRKEKSVEEETMVQPMSSKRKMKLRAIKPAVSAKRRMRSIASIDANEEEIGDQSVYSAPGLIFRTKKA
ncbi:uncharacterized protein RAG0_04091 [Rhynchosporium agropyri]|uniref:Uncharacterized protein n=1 Tax=Rhynchosporium agropyri TaxID=914238 RepID=A0A1E1K830_9HELO|nr:uncharacterized protein RAG0_04091 [Rhynchosporium agropyri]